MYCALGPCKIAQPHPLTIQVQAVGPQDDTLGNLCGLRFETVGSGQDVVFADDTASAKPGNHVSTLFGTQTNLPWPLANGSLDSTYEIGPINLSGPITCLCDTCRKCPVRMLTLPYL